MITKLKNKQKILFVIIAILFLVVLGLIYLKKDTESENYFNEIQLSENNLIVNNSLPTYLDTILSVGLDQAGLVGVKVVINPMSDNTENLIPDYELKAHVREWNGTFYLFTGNFSKLESIKILSHEIIHIHQYYSEELKYFEGKVYWRGDEYDLNNLDYDKRPWEEDAFDRDKPLSNAIRSILIN